MGEVNEREADRERVAVERVHGVWVGPRLSLLEQLSIILYRKLGYEFVLWLYDECEGVPPGTAVRDASEILPRDSIFRYAGRPLPGASATGIGSVAHWSDQFQMKLLYDHGGIYSQLDVTLLEPVDLSAPYVFVKGNTPETCFMKCPKGSDFARDTYEMLRATINPGTVHSIGWCESLEVLERSIRGHGLEGYVLADGLFVSGLDFRTRSRPRSARLIHWWNVALGILKHYPARGSFYGRLLEEAGLWSPSLRNDMLHFRHVAGRRIADIRWRLARLRGGRR